VRAASGRDRPFALGRRVLAQDVEAFGQAAQALGFRPRLASGWREVSLERVARLR